MDHFDRMRVFVFRRQRRRHVTVINVEITEVGALVHHRTVQSSLSTVKRHRVEYFLEGGGGVEMRRHLGSFSFRFKGRRVNQATIYIAPSLIEIFKV